MNIIAGAIVIGGGAFWLWFALSLIRAGFTKKRNRYRIHKPVPDERSSIEQFKRICLDQRSRQ